MRIPNAIAVSNACTGLKYNYRVAISGEYAFLQHALQRGEIELHGQFLLGSNYTFLVHVHYQGETYPAVYKPCRGEQPLWDFPENTLAGREVAAYLVSEALGWRFVPYTVMREDGPFGPGSLQRYIPYDPNYHYFNFSVQDKARLRPVALFDLLCNNADRKGSHILIELHTRNLWLIDHGLCFHEEDKLRTVLWDFAGQDIPPDLLNDLERFRAHLDSDPGLLADLGRYLTPGELTALAARADALLQSGVYPLPPPDRRAFPYPPL
ncbi:MAG: SCO1664 family protein [Anaerolineales bacterium]